MPYITLLKHAEGFFSLSGISTIYRGLFIVKQIIQWIRTAMELLD